MHPILSRGRLGLYLLCWIPIGGLLVVLAGLVGSRTWLEAAVLALPLALVYAFICLGSWSLCRALPLERGTLPRLAGAHAAAAALSSGLWLVVGRGWAAALSRLLRDPGIETRYRETLPLFFTTGTLLFGLIAAVHYLLIAFESSRAAERRAYELQVLAREAQLKALTAQVNPHFLFNSLNAISALAGTDAAAARRMCLLLAEFLRQSLGLGGRDRVTLAEEMALVESFLAVEQVRFGSRLAVVKRIAPDAERCEVPPLLLQPLVENAVNHGIAGLIDGGTVRIEAECSGGRLEISVQNPRDPDRSPRRGHGLGLANVDARLAALHGADARLDVRPTPDGFRVTLRLPAVPAAAAATPAVRDGGASAARAGLAS